jgi:hypothetical protein
MKVLNVYKSKLEQPYYELTKVVTDGQPSKAVNLFEGEVDYDQFLQDILDSDVITAWW